MQYEILLSKSENTKAIEEQEQSRFIKSVLESLEVDIDYDPEEPLSGEDRQRLRSNFRQFNLGIIDDRDGGLKILLGQDLIAEWYKATYKLKQDLSEPDPHNRLYLEMSVSFWTIFEEEEGGESEETEIA